MGKKEFTKKQLRKQLTVLSEASVLKQDMKKSFDALKKLDHVMTGQKIGGVTVTKSMNKKIKNAKRYIEDLWDKITDGEIEEKESEDEEEVEKKNEQSEGHGKMYNALSGIKEGKVIKMNESTLKRIVERVIVEQGKVIKEEFVWDLEEATLQTKIAMVDCAETYDIPEIVINLAGSMSNNMMGAVPEGKNPYMIWMAAFISNVIKDRRTDSKLLEDIEGGSGCMYEILKSQDMLDVV